MSQRTCDQQSRVGKHGLYRFDIGQGGDQLDVITDGERWHFPSKRIPARTGVAPLDESGAVTGSNATPNVSAPTPYYLDFTLSDTQSLAPRNNHIAIDPGGAQVVLQKTASRSRVRVGDVVTWTLKIENRSSTDFVRIGGRGGILVRDILPSEMRLVPDSARAFVDGTPVNLAPQSDAHQLVFQRADESESTSLELSAGSRIFIRYQTVVGASARAGQSLENRAEVVEAGGVRLSGIARVKVHVVGDTVFDRSWVRGRVFWT